MKTFSALVLIRNGNAEIPHTAHVTAASSFAAQQMLTAQYGQGNLLTVPTEVSGGSTTNNAPWMGK